jgi:hypothetical protein
MNNITNNLSTQCQEVVKNSTEQMPKSESNHVIGPDGFMREIKTDSTKNEWIDIGGVKKWGRECPKCKINIWTKSKDMLKSGRLCRSCGYKRIKIVKEENFIRNCPKCSGIIKYTDTRNRNSAEKKKTECKKCLNQALREMYIGKTYEELHGKKKALEIKKKISKTSINRDVSVGTRNKLSVSRKEYHEKNPDVVRGKNNPMFGVHRFGKSNPNYGNKWTDEMKERNRHTSLENVKNRGGLFHAYNKNACKYFDELSKHMGWNLQHAENGGEVFIHRYYIDAYDKQRNIIVEYDEPRHYSTGKLKQKDIDRMNNIIQATGCKFYRYNERTKELKQYA